MKMLRLISVLMIAAVFSAGCAGKKPLLPAHDEVLVYKLPYDLTYLRIIDALQTVPDWDLEMTDKENGWIRVRNINYSQFNDADKRLVTVMIKRLAAGQTSVEIRKEDQQVLGGGDLLKAISRELGQEVSL